MGLILIVLCTKLSDSLQCRDTPMISTVLVVEISHYLVSWSKLMFVISGTKHIVFITLVFHPCQMGGFLRFIQRHHFSWLINNVDLYKVPANSTNFWSLWYKEVFALIYVVPLQYNICKRDTGHTSHLPCWLPQSADTLRTARILQTTIDRLSWRRRRHLQTHGYESGSEMTCLPIEGWRSLGMLFVAWMSHRLTPITRTTWASECSTKKPWPGRRQSAWLLAKLA